MTETVVKSAALLLGRLLVEEVKYLDAVTDEVEELQIELETLAAFINEAVNRHHQDNFLRNLLLHARNVTYDCEDVIETYVLKVARHGYEGYEGCQLGSVLRWTCILRNAIAVHKFQSNIKRLRRRIFSLQIKMTGYWVPLRIGAGSQPTDRPSEERRRVYPHEKKEYDFVGLKDNLEMLLSAVLDEEPGKRVIAIHGMGGIGKSTLARELYHHSEIRSHFQGFAWTTVSKQFQTDSLIKQLISQILLDTRDEEKKKEVENLIKSGQPHNSLYSLMEATKSLVVVDDVWSSNDWEKLRAAFPRRHDKTGSKIVLTTRNEETFRGLERENMVYPHAMKGLDEERSWELFEKTAFQSGECKDAEKRKLGQEMLHHCGGVPLAITVLGEALKPKEANEWQMLCNKILTQVLSGDVASNKLYKEVYDVLRVSYDDLPSHLKCCFLHLANFPEDFEIPAYKLFQLWVAEGIVFKEDPSEVEEEVAERYLNELVSRNMVQVGSWVKGHSGRIETCRVHDLMRDICIEIAKEEGFIQVISCESPTQLMATLPQRDKRLRRVAIHPRSYVIPKSSTSASPSIQVSKAPHLLQVSKAPSLRSLLIFEHEGYLEEEGKPFVRRICKNFPLLRVFELGNYGFRGKLVSEIGSLIHLKYLGLANTYITKLPSSVVKLQCLQTLDLRTKWGFISIPNVLWKMKDLRNLYLPFDIERKYRGYEIKGGGKLLLRGLQCLQTVQSIDLDRVDLEGLSELSSLKRVKAFCKSNMIALYPFLSSESMRSFSLVLHVQIMKEESLILSSCKSLYKLEVYDRERNNNSFGRPICFEMFPRSLALLCLHCLCLDPDPLRILEKLPNLAHLEFNSCDCGTNITCSAGGFPELDYLEFKYTRFGKWEVEEGALPKLKTLRLYRSSREVKLPRTLLSSVNVVVIQGW